MEYSSDLETFLIPTSSGTILYAPLSGVLLFLEGELREWSSETLAPILAKYAAKTDYPVTYPANSSLSPPFLGIIPTRACNLRCRYCAFEDSSDTLDTLDIPTALMAVRWFSDICSREGRASLDIEFFGGEPMVCPDLVHAVALSSWESSVARTMTTNLRIITNGVCPPASRQLMADLFAKVILSLDGPPEIHNRLRPFASGNGSFDHVAKTARIVGDGQADLSLRVCVTDETAHRMGEIASFFIDNFCPSEVSFEPLSANDMTGQSNLSPPDPISFAQGFFEAESVLGPAGIPLVHATSSIEHRQVSFCPVGRDGAIVGPGGRLFACYLCPKEWERRGLELAFGRFDGAGQLLTDETRLSRIRTLNVTTKKRCQSCFVKWHCAGGCHVNHTYPGCDDRPDDLCTITRTIALKRLLDTLELPEESRSFAASPYDPRERCLRVEAHTDE
ncbi:MAG: radical SAM protein [Deltaproteobacteria bacterium]|nr:radical SAM protein [Deltaproteobacteria bacterium]